MTDGQDSGSGDAVTGTILMAAHAAAGTTIVATLVGWLPAIAAAAAIIWYIIQIWESRTVQRIVHPNQTPEAEATVLAAKAAADTATVARLAAEDAVELAAHAEKVATTMAEVAESEAKQAT